jgi:cellulose synthase/poly-beta-1,6-N-acetylglucosamine synthase-like glycosyltransferase
MSAGAAHRRHYADNWLIYAVDYAMLFEVTDPGLVNLRLPVPIGGSSNHFRTELLRKGGGWDAWNVTENADLGLRLARFGYKVATFDSETLEDIPAAIPAFLRQRTRWLKGWMQTLFINMRNLRRLTRRLGFCCCRLVPRLDWAAPLSARCSDPFLRCGFSSTPYSGHYWHRKARAKSSTARSGASMRLLVRSLYSGRLRSL